MENPNDPYHYYGQQEQPPRQQHRNEPPNSPISRYAVYPPPATVASEESLNNAFDEPVRRLSFDSLAYSEVTTGMNSTTSSESLRLNGYLPSESSSLLLFPLFQTNRQQRQQSQQQPLEPQQQQQQQHRHHGYFSRYNNNQNKNSKSNLYRPTDTFVRSVMEDKDGTTTKTTEWFQHPRVRTCYVLAVLLALTTVLLLTSGILDTEWLGRLSILGIRGMRAQGIADASLIKTEIQGRSIYLGNSHNDPLHDGDYVGGKEPDNGCETTIMLIRHCEKGDLRSHCNYLGFERAAFLASQFGDSHEERWPAPSEIYALKSVGRGQSGRHENFREIETVQFLAKKLHMTVDESYDTYNRKALARKILVSILNGEQCGRLILISWKHNDIARLSHLLGMSDWRQRKSAKCSSTSSRKYLLTRSFFSSRSLDLCGCLQWVFLLGHIVVGCGPFEGCPMDYKGSEFDQVWELKYVYRSFHHGPKEEMTYKHWDIFGSVQYEHFDPLAFAKTAGDYPKGGTNHAGRWADPKQELYD